MNDQLFAQFHALPASIKNVVSSSEGMAVIEALEERYGVVLAELILRLLVHDLPWTGFADDLQKQQELAKDQADAVARELSDGLLAPLMSFIQNPLPASARQQASTAPSAVPKTVTQSLPTTDAVSLTRGNSQKPTVPRTATIIPPTSVVLPRRTLEAPKEIVAVLEQTPTPTNTFVPKAVIPETPQRQQIPKPPFVPVPAPRPVQPQQAVQQSVPSVSNVSTPLGEDNTQIPGLALQQLARGRKSEYFISADDEEDVNQHRLRLSGIVSSSPLRDEAVRVLDGIIAKFHLTFASPMLERRLRSLLASRLNDIRSRTALQEALMRSVKIGGMQYDARIAGQLAAEADQQAVLLRDLRLLSQPQQTSTVPPQSEIPAQKPQPVPQQAQVANPSPAAVSTPVPPSIPVSPVVVQQPQVVPVPEFLNRTVVRRMQPVQDPDRPFLQDVRHPPAPMDLADELGALSIQDFRKLGTTADAVQKILQKIELLTEQSFLKRSEGITSWRASEVYQQYLALGRDSMVSGKSVEQVIADRQQQGASTLSLEEFSAIADLNRKMIA